MCVCIHTHTQCKNKEWYSQTTHCYFNDLSTEDTKKAQINPPNQEMSQTVILNKVSTM